MIHDITDRDGKNVFKNSNKTVGMTSYGNDLGDGVDTTSTNCSTFPNTNVHHMKSRINEARRPMLEECYQGMNSHKRWRMMSPQDGRPFEEDEHHQPMMENKGVGNRIGAELKAKKSTILDSVLDILPHNLLPKIKRIGATRELDPRWKHPFTAIVAGPTSCGKTVFTLKFIDNAKEMIYPPPEKSGLDLR